MKRMIAFLLLTTLHVSFAGAADVIERTAHEVKSLVLAPVIVGPTSDRSVRLHEQN